MNENHPPEVEAQDDDYGLNMHALMGEEVPDLRDEMDDN